MHGSIIVIFDHSKANCSPLFSVENLSVVSNSYRLNRISNTLLGSLYEFVSALFVRVGKVSKLNTLIY